MSKLKEAISTILLAAYYSFSFCWRNSKGETIARIVISALNTILLYLGIQATGIVINAVQSALQESSPVSHGLFSPMLFLIGVLLFGVVIGQCNWYLKSKWNQNLRFANQRELNDHRATLDVARFRSKEYDDLSKRIQELPMSWQTRIWFSEEVITLFTTIVSFILFGTSLLWYAPVYALVLILFALPMMVVEFQLVSSWWSLFQEMVPHHKKRSVLEKPYHGANTFIQALMFNQMPSLRREIDINVGDVIDSYNRMRAMSMRKEMCTHTLAVAGLCGVLAHAVWSTVTYAGEIGTLTIIIAAARTFQNNLETIMSLIADQWNNAKGIILIEKDFLGLKSLIHTEYPVVPRFDKVPCIRFDQVYFTYPDTDTEVLKNVSFTIEPGTKAAIVGKSGHGKSTLLALLMRHYDPTSGAVYTGDINLRNIEPAVWSNVASALTQEYTVLERRIGEEIASSRLDQPIDLQLVANSAQFANFDEVVNSDTNGYQSQIGIEFGGRDFSGGERQRLALARVHYRGTPILVLDEPDAKLDPESAQKVIDGVFALRGVTVIMITHHVSRAEQCDTVIVMGRGEVVDQGSHSELMERCETYRSLYEKDKKRLGPES